MCCAHVSYGMCKIMQHLDIYLAIMIPHALRCVGLPVKENTRIYLDFASNFFTAAHSF